MAKFICSYLMSYIILQESGRRNSWFRVPRFGRQQQGQNISPGGGTNYMFGGHGSSITGGTNYLRVPSTDSCQAGASASTTAALADSSCIVEIVLQWSPSAVSQWLEAIGLPMYCYAFLEHEISGRELLALERSDFKDVGVKKVGMTISR